MRRKRFHQDKYSTSPRINQHWWIIYWLKIRTKNNNKKIKFKGLRINVWLKNNQASLLFNKKIMQVKSKNKCKLIIKINNNLHKLYKLWNRTSKFISKIKNNNLKRSTTTIQIKNKLIKINNKLNNKFILRKKFKNNQIKI